MEIVDIGNRLEWLFKITGEQTGYYTKTDKTDAYIETGLKGFAWAQTDADAYYREKNGHHDACAKADDIARDLFNDHVSLYLKIIS
uniref:Uncharacterized protein n=1 Tax=Prevotella sp. GTC17259 TaxID=3236795 RepID=A0AB33JC32_9BACT